jgi:hypothetical protein
VLVAAEAVSEFSLRGAASTSNPFVLHDVQNNISHSKLNGNSVEQCFFLLLIHRALILLLLN